MGKALQLGETIVKEVATGKVISETKPSDSGVIVLEKKKKKHDSIKEQVKRGEETLGVIASPKTTAVLGGALAVLSNPAGALSLASQGAKSLASSFGGLSLKGKVATIVGAPIVAGTLLQSQKARDTALNVINPLENLERGKELGKVIEGDLPFSLKTATTIGAVAGGTALAGGLGYLGYKALKDKDKVTTLPSSYSSLPKEVAGLSPITPPSSSGSNQGVLQPLYPETETISTGIKKKRKVAKRKVESPRISQRVNIMISNKSNSVGIRNERYLNERVFN